MRSRLKLQTEQLRLQLSQCVAYGSAAAHRQAMPSGKAVPPALLDRVLGGRYVS